MSRKAIQSRLDAFLQSEGLLGSADQAVLQSARQKYWAEYKRAHKQAKRHESKSITVLYSLKEAKRIAAAAGQSSLTSFVKASALAAAQGRPMVDAVTLGELRQLLERTYFLLQETIEEERVPARLGDRLLDQVEVLERQVMNFINPKTGKSDF